MLPQWSRGPLPPFGVPPSGGSPDRVNAELQTSRLPRIATTLSTLLLFLVIVRGDELSNEWTTGQGHRWRPIGEIITRAPGFTPMDAAETGVRFTNQVSLASAMVNNNLLNGSGVALGDVDGDGLIDIYFCNLEGPNTLFKNLGDWRFEQVPDAAGAACEDVPSTGAVFADITGDGHLDLLVNSLGHGTHLYINDGSGRFTRRENSGLLERYGATSMALADINGDGWLDLYVANYADMSILRSGGAIAMRMVNGEMTPTGPYADRLRVVNGALVELGEPDQLYLNGRDGTFNPVSWTDGRFVDEHGDALREAPMELGLSVMLRDLNGDGHPDIYVCNDFDFPDRIWINDGKGSFRALPNLAMRKTSHFSMAVDVADVNRDGFDDIFVADMASRSHRLRMTQSGVFNPPIRTVGVFDDRPMASHNTLQLNRGDGSWAEIAHFSGVAASDWTWSVAFLDVDLDGYDDILTGTGHAFDILDLDAMQEMEQIRRRSRPTTEQMRQTLRLFPPLQVPNYAFRNRGDLTFEEVGTAWGFNSTQVSHGMALGDLDGDGDLDVVINCLNAPPLIYRNNASAPRVAVRLRGNSPNTRGIGARVRLKGGPVPQEQVMISGGRYVSGDDAMRVFATGNVTAGLSIEVQWPSGGRSEITDVRPNAIYEIHEPNTGDASGGHPPRDVTFRPRQQTAPWFIDVSGILDLTHHEPAYDDFQRQPLLTRKRSQSGPGIAWLDLNDDGWDDLIMGNGRGGRPEIRINVEGLAFVRPPGSSTSTSASASASASPALPNDLAGIVGGLPSPTDSKRMRIFAGLADYEDGELSGGAILELDPVSGSFIPRVQGLPTSIGPMAVADIDGDGFLDLFVGGHGLAGQYPKPAPSYILKGVAGGGFIADVANNRTLAEIGIVNGAVWSDLNNDGSPDLILTCDWGPVRVFWNRDGRLHAAAPSAGLDDATGWWNGVATGDFDGDGQMDFVATNWGLNSAFKGSNDQPFTVFHDDLNGDGSIDLIEAELDPVTGRLVPRRNLIVLGAIFPFLHQHYPTHAAFAETDVPGLLQDRFDGMGQLAATEFAHCVFVNRGDRFEKIPLPLEAQWAPAAGVAVADFNGDGIADIALAQNFFATVPDLPRQDEGLGLVLRGYGDGTFTALSPADSGIRVYGEQRGLAVGDFNNDGRMDIVVTQNGAAVRLFQNAGGRPGVRVRLTGPKDNPWGIGARVHLVDERGVAGNPTEIQAGSGYWSQNSLTPILTHPGKAHKVHVRWPDGKIQVVEVPEAGGMAEIRYELNHPVRGARN